MPVTLTEYSSLRRLVAASNNELWWENDVAAGQMVELADANGDIDTSDQLNMFEAYQKAMIINGANLKVADFGNVKLTSTALGTAHAHGDLLTQDQGSGDFAYMTVDFTNTAKTATYGKAYYAGTATAFNTADAITGSGSGSGFTPSAVTDPPHWYSWTVYPGGASGEMPIKAYLGCLYNGRTVLAGNPTAPNQWYMSRQTNPWDWLDANDDQAPVRGGSSDLGELGDIIRCLAPYKDDYLIFGCASSVWILFGDPRHGGALREFSLTTGIFGANSYCWDNNNNFYFWGDNGLYRAQVPGVPQCVSQFKLPSIVKDEAATPSTHRITLIYDSGRHGILVTITVLATGANSNYWYDLNALDENGVGGFFPESYPITHGVYSGLYYNSNTASLRGMLLGGTDGYLRVFDDTVKDDVTSGAVVTAIQSYVGIGPMAMSGVARRNGMLAGVDLTVAGGGVGGSQADSDDVDFRVYTARTSEQVLELLTANANPDFAGTFVGPGNVRGTTRRQTVRNASLGIRLQNTAEGESWAFEDLSIYLKESGRKK